MIQIIKSRYSFSMILIGGNERNHPLGKSGKSKKTWRLFL
jgi:hypothetical protein